MKNDRISGRQRDIINRMLKGESRKEITCTLGISPKTIECHLHRAYRVYGVSNAVALVGKLYGLPRS